MKAVVVRISIAFKNSVKLCCTNVCCLSAIAASLQRQRVGERERQRAPPLLLDHARV